MMGEQRCKFRFIVVNRHELNRMHNFQAAEKVRILILGGALHPLPVHPLRTTLTLRGSEVGMVVKCVGMGRDGKNFYENGWG